MIGKCGVSLKSLGPVKIQTNVLDMVIGKKFFVWAKSIVPLDAKRDFAVLRDNVKFVANITNIIKMVAWYVDFFHNFLTGWVVLVDLHHNGLKKCS